MGIQKVPSRTLGAKCLGSIKQPVPCRKLCDWVQNLAWADLNERQRLGAGQKGTLQAGGSHSLFEQEASVKGDQDTVNFWASRLTSALGR